MTNRNTNPTTNTQCVEVGWKTFAARVGLDRRTKTALHRRLPVVNWVDDAVPTGKVHYFQCTHCIPLTMQLHCITWWWLVYHLHPKPLAAMPTSPLYLQCNPPLPPTSSPPSGIFFTPTAPRAALHPPLHSPKKRCEFSTTRSAPSISYFPLPPSFEHRRLSQLLAKIYDWSGQRKITRSATFSHSEVIFQ